MGGIGKTTLTARLARDLAQEFAVVYWRSLRNAPPVEEWLGGAIAALSAGQTIVPDGFEARLGLLLHLVYAHQHACWCWTTWKPSWSRARRRCATLAATRDMEWYWRDWPTAFIRSCLVLTSREKPLRADDVAIRWRTASGWIGGGGRPDLALAWQGISRR